MHQPTHTDRRPDDRMTKISVPLSVDERDALRRVAAYEDCTTGEYVRLLVQRSLIWHGVFFDPTAEIKPVDKDSDSKSLERRTQECEAEIRRMNESFYAEIARIYRTYNQAAKSVKESFEELIKQLNDNNTKIQESFTKVGESFEETDKRLRTLEEWRETTQGDGR